MGIENRKFNTRNKGIIKFIVDGCFLIECDFINNKYYWTNLNEISRNNIMYRQPISRAMAKAYYDSKLEEYRKNNFDRAHTDTYAEIDIKIKLNQIPNVPSVEEQFLKNELIKKLHEAENTLTNRQKERIEKHIINDVPVVDLAIIEQTNRRSIFESIHLGLEKIKKILKSL